MSIIPSIKAQLHQKEERERPDEEGKAMNGEYHHCLKRTKGNGGKQLY